MNQGFVSHALWAAEDAAIAAGGRLLGADSWIATGLSIDTRTLAPGDIFVALKDVRDGHDFVAEAFAKGAAAALVSDAEKVQGLGPLIVVGDVLEGLQALALSARARSAARRVAITGSVGKTSVKEAVAAALAASGRTHHAVESFNNHIGVPLTLARMPADSAFGVFEIGMNHRHEIAPLAQLVEPHVAIITAIAPAHIENLGSLEAIADEKGDIFSGLADAGVALFPNEAPHADRLMTAAEKWAPHIVRFGISQECEARLLKFEPNESGASVEADILGRKIGYRIGASGAQWALNSVAALAAADLAGGDIHAAAHALARFEDLAGRGKARKITAGFGAFTLVDDAYNANPASVSAALATLKARPATRRIAALGDMLELGDFAPGFHAGLAEPIAAAGVDLVFCAGPLMGALWDALPQQRRGGYADTSDDLIPMIAAALRDGDVVLVKGSKGSKMARVVDALAKLDHA